MKRKEPVATVHEVDGKLILEDPVAVAVIRAVAKSNCKMHYDGNADRIQHFKQRIIDRDISKEEWVIVLLNMDDDWGKALGDALMPGYDWSEIRNAGMTPLARGLASRKWVEKMLYFFDEEATIKLKACSGTYNIVVVDHGVAEIWSEQ